MNFIFDNNCTACNKHKDKIIFITTTGHCANCGKRIFQPVFAKFYADNFRKIEKGKNFYIKGNEYDGYSFNETNLKTKV